MAKARSSRLGTAAAREVLPTDRAALCARFIGVAAMTLGAVAFYSARQLPHHQDVNPITLPFLRQRTGVRERFQQLHRTQVGEQPKLLPQPQQCGALRLGHAIGQLRAARVPGLRRVDQQAPASPGLPAHQLVLFQSRNRF